MKRIICILMVIMITVLSALSFSGFTAQSSRQYHSADDTGAYFLRFSGKHIEITRYSTYTLSAEFDVSRAINAVCAYRGKVIILCDDSSNRQLIVYVYYLDSDYLDSFAIYGATLYDSTDFCCDNDRFYLEDPKDSSRLFAYSLSGNLSQTYSFDDDITGLCAGYHSGVYVTAGDTLYSLSGSGLYTVGSNVIAPLFPADSDVLASAKGKVYILDGNGISKTFSVDTDYRASSACVIGHRVYYPCGRTIYGYDIEGGERISMYQTSFDTVSLYAYGNQILAVSESGASSSISRDSFTELKTTEQNENNNQNQNDNPQNADTNQSDTGISSDVYLVDSQQYTISGITPGTTVSKFKANMNYDGYALTIYRNNDVRTSGYVGTAMTAVFTRNGSTYTYELSVTGDITGEGNCNSRDLYLLMDYLIGAADFNGVYLSAADISDNNTVDAADLALMKNQI